MYNYWQRLKVGSTETYTAAKLVTLPIETATLSLGGAAYEMLLRQRPDVIVDRGAVATVRTIQFVDSSTLADPGLRMGAGIDGDIATLNVSGHSLGGHLAMAFTRLFPSTGASALGVNGLGFRPSNTNVANLFGMLDGASSFDQGRILNLFGIGGIEFAAQNTFLLSQPGGYEGVFIETGLGHFLGHKVGQMTDSLALYDLLLSIDPALRSSEPKDAVAKLGALLEASSVIGKDTLERGTSALLKLFGLSPLSLSEIDNRAALYGRLVDVRAEIENRIIGGSEFAIDVLVGKDSLGIEALAYSHIGYRYALREINPFAIVGSESTYAPFNTDANAATLDIYDHISGLGSLTQAWIEDRSRLLFAELRRATNDTPSHVSLPSESAIATEYRFYRESKEELFMALPGTAPAPTRFVGRRSMPKSIWLHSPTIGVGRW